MKIANIKSLTVSDIKIIRFEKFNDDRGYFTETYNKSCFQIHCDFLKNINFKQINEVFSFANTFRGLHIQWEPNMGKLVRLIYGRLIDFALDLRSGSSTYKKIISYELENTYGYNEWIWIPPGFAHGTLLLENSMIEYFCTETYNPKCEQSISIYSMDIDWTVCDKNHKKYISNTNNILNLRMSPRDRHAISILEFENLNSY